ncbi:helix-turn-helix domain-containing protein [Christiangramia sabulilitoris]|uniref:Helix-turn-helix domain-containing protein n=1 Tax=Christiangramia sabulilitoris TaxID=2583991 RepID=A0A550I3D8_9FLAO|nr:helix-turn-helix domain-containing protein [Christiangramia sabulilitoris]TRO65493.1 helix-turn-helix domain-containing protein [Christiangramia sabulilitoris]
MEHSVLLQSVTPEKLTRLIQESVKSQLETFQKTFRKHEAEDELLTREETCKLLKINSSTLWAWTNKGKVKAYGIANRRYYKRSELMESLTELKK